MDTTKSCYDCNHRMICGMFGIFWTAINDVTERFAELLPNGKTDIPIAIANNCNQYAEEKKEEK